MEKAKNNAGKVNVTFRMAKDRVKLLDELGKCFDRDRSYLVNQAVEEFLIRQQWQLDEAERTVSEVKDGKFLTEEDFLTVRHRFLFSE